MYDPPRFQFHHHKYIPLPKQPVAYASKITCPGVSSLILQECRPVLGSMNVPACLSACIFGRFVYSLLSPALAILHGSAPLPIIDSLSPSFRSARSFRQISLARLAISFANTCQTAGKATSANQLWSFSPGVSFPLYDVLETSPSYCSTGYSVTLASGADWGR